MRLSRSTDLPSSERLYRDAFPSEDLWPLVSTLLDGVADVLSLVSVSESALAGHIAFTRCSVDAPASRAALLGPLAVAPQLQRQGVGGALIREGLRRITAERAACVLVLGDPGYYARFGFSTETRITPPYPLASEWHTAWQSLHLGPADARCEGRLKLPPPWMNPALWSP